MRKYADKYFEVTNRLIKKYDPNHLILGVRFNKRPPIDVLEASVGKIDVYSVNQYSNTPQAYKNMLKEIWEISDRPIIISEFSFFSQDGLSGNKNIDWPSEGRVANREQRAEYYYQFVGGMAGTSFMIGCDWFQWNDEPPSGRADGEDLNCGIVSIYDQPYTEMIEKVKKCSQELNRIHISSNSMQNSKTWKDDPKRI